MVPMTSLPRKSQPLNLEHAAENNLAMSTADILIHPSPKLPQWAMNLIKVLHDNFFGGLDDGRGCGAIRPLQCGLVCTRRHDPLKSATVSGSTDFCWCGHQTQGSASSALLGTVAIEYHHSCVLLRPFCSLPLVSWIGFGGYDLARCPSMRRGLWHGRESANGMSEMGRSWRPPECVRLVTADLRRYAVSEWPNQGERGGTRLWHFGWKIGGIRRQPRARTLGLWEVVVGDGRLQRRAPLGPRFFFL